MSRQSHRLSAMINVVEDIPSLGRADAAELVDQIIDAAVDQLRRDPALPARAAADWDLAFADLRQRGIELVHRRIDDHVARTDVVRLLEQEI